MRDILFPRWQGAFLALFLLADGLFLPASPERIWMLFWSTLITAWITFLWLKFLSARNARDLSDLCCHQMPRTLFVPIYSLIVLFCVAGIIRSLFRMAAFWRSTSFPSTPHWFMILILLWIGWNAGRRGRTAVAMWSYPTLFFVLLIVIASLIITIPDCDIAHLAEIPKGFTFMPAIQSFWILLPLMLCTQTKNLPSTRACVIGVLIGGGLLTAITLRAFTVLGAGVSKLPYPVFSAAGIFSVGDFLQRGEVVFGSAFALCESVRIGLFWTLGRDMLQHIFQKKIKKQPSS